MRYEYDIKLSVESDCEDYWNILSVFVCKHHDIRKSIFINIEKQKELTEKVIWEKNISNLPNVHLFKPEYNFFKLEQIVRLKRCFVRQAEGQIGHQTKLFSKKIVISRVSTCPSASNKTSGVIEEHLVTSLLRFSHKLRSWIYSLTKMLKLQKQDVRDLI